MCQSDLGGKLAGQTGPRPSVGGNVRGRKWCGREAWLLAPALAPTCRVTLNKSPPPPQREGQDGSVAFQPATRPAPLSSDVHTGLWHEVSLCNCYYILGCF